MNTITEYLTLVSVRCCNCGVVFAMPDYMQSRLKEKGGTFYCPNGHSQHYCKSDNDVLKEKLQREKSARERSEAEAQEWCDKFQSERKDKEKLKTRIKNGVCPCCRRNFVNVNRHMKTKHPEYLIEKRKRGRPRKK